MAYDGDTAERAAYNCIAAVTHGGRSPFQSTNAMYEDFLDEWPESRYADNVRRGLYQAYAAQRSTVSLERQLDESEQKFLYCIRSI